MLAGEEKDFYMRLRKAGKEMFYLPDMILYHITPNERTSVEFVKNQTIGLGVSEKLRALNIGKSEYTRSLLKELFKWCASWIIFTGFALSFQFPKAFMIIRFSYWLSKGLLSETTNY